MRTIRDFLPQNEEERRDLIEISPIYKRLRDYIQEEWSVETLFFKYETVVDILVYATCLYDFVSTKHCTNPNNRSVLYLADELAMKEAIDYIDAKVNEDHHYEKDEPDDTDRSIAEVLAEFEKWEGTVDPEDHMKLWFQIVAQKADGIREALD